jgi:hypothetical protein
MKNHNFKQSLIVAILFFMLFIAAKGAWALGGKETNSAVAEPADGASQTEIQIINVSAEARFGMVDFAISIPNPQRYGVSSVALHRAGGGGSTLLFPAVVDDGAFDPAALETGDSGDEWVVNSQTPFSQPDEAYRTELRRFTREFYSGVPAEDDNLSLRFVPNRGDMIYIQVHDTQGPSYVYRVEFTAMLPGNVETEDGLFGGNEAAYRENIVSLMFSVLDFPGISAEVRSAFSSAAGSFLGMADGATVPPQVLRKYESWDSVQLAQAQTALRNYIFHQIETGLEESDYILLPSVETYPEFLNRYDDIESEWLKRLPVIRGFDFAWDAVYSDHADPYLKLYLLFLEELGKPLIGDHHKLTAAIENSGTGANYRWDNYRELSSDEREIISTAAWSYLNWGAEYYPPQPDANNGRYLVLERSENGFTFWTAQPEARLDGPDGQLWLDPGLPSGGDRVPDTNYVDSDGFAAITRLPSILRAGNDEGNIHVYDSLGTIPPDSSLAEQLGLSGTAQTGSTIFAGTRAGLPLSYAPYGIDGPRSFNYKLSQMRNAANILRSQSDADVSSYLTETYGYFSFLFESGADLEILEGEGAISFTPQSGDTVHAIKPFTSFRAGNSASVPLEILTGTSEQILPSFLGVDPMGFLGGVLSYLEGSPKALGPDRFPTVFGRQPLEELRNFYRFDPQSPYIGSDSLPGYFLSSAHINALRGDFIRFQPADLERMSVIVADVKNAKVGDLLVSYGQGTTKDPLTLGIIVRLPVGDTAGMTADEFMDQTLVIWVRDGAGQVSIGWWGNAGQQYRGFSMNPRSFHVRKIVARINPADTSDDGEHPWDFTSEPEVSFETSVSLFADNGNIDSTATLIPNTGEFRQLRINLSRVVNGVRRPAQVGEDQELQISFLQALDPNHEDEPQTNQDYGNIYTNLGTGFEVAVIFYDEEINDYQAVPVVEFLRTDDYLPRILTSASPPTGYQAGSDGELFDQWQFTIDGVGNIAVSWDDDSGSGDRSSSRLGIRPVKRDQSHTVRPGDDIQLRFSITGAIDPDPDGQEIPEELALPEMQLYDKKMLWRANLYIVEDDSESGGDTGDWNDLHRWNAPATEADAANAPWWWSQIWGYNAWNRIFDPDGSNWNEIINDGQLLVGELSSAFSDQPLEGGGQVLSESDMLDFVWFQDNTIITDATGYEYNGHDSPFEFNFKLYQQYRIIEQMYFLSGERFLTAKVDWGALGTLQALVEAVLPMSQLNLLFPPGGDPETDQEKADRLTSQVNQRPVYGRENESPPAGGFANYLRRNADYPYGFNGGAAAGMPRLPSGDSDYIEIDGVPYYPYVPGLSNALGNGVAEQMPGHHSIGGVSFYTIGKEFAGYSAGADCVGFTYRSMSYEGSDYELLSGGNSGRFLDDATNGAVYWGESRVLLRYPYPGDNDAEVISFKPTIGQAQNLHLVKPGDLMYYDYTGENQNQYGAHLAIVLRVEDVDGNGEIEPGEVWLIESTYGSEQGVVFGNVHAVRTLDTYGTNPDRPRDWVVVRLVGE